MLKVGDQAPDFTGISGDGIPLSLSDYLGSKVVLYFYPKDHTPMCTVEACSIRDQWTGFEEAGIVVIGISGDSADSHKNFAAKYALPFILFADKNREVTDIYGAWRKGGASLYGRSFIGVKRTTFLIDESGKIVKIFMDPNNKVHGKEILDAFAELG